MKLEKKLEISQHASLVDEAILILYYWINYDNMEEIKEKNADNYQLNIDDYNKKWDVILEIYNDIKEKLKNKMEQVEFYFKNCNEQISFLGTFAILWNYNKLNKELQIFEERFKIITEAEKVKEFAKIINCEEAAGISKENLKNLSDLIQFIDNSSYNKETKWEIINIFNNPEKYYNEMYSILGEVIELLKTKHRHNVMELEREFFEYWNECQKQEDIIESMKNNFNVSWEVSNKGTILVPLIFIPFNTTFSFDDENDASTDIIRLSIFFDKRFLITSKKKFKKEDVVNVGKLLCDKSKVDILEFISRKPSYGKEIANELNLSTATISYHINALLKIGFVKAEVISNKVYYSIDRLKITTYIEDLKNYFTDGIGE